MKYLAIDSDFGVIGAIRFEWRHLKIKSQLIDRDPVKPCEILEYAREKGLSEEKAREPKYTRYPDVNP
jgi:hypothetical protein